MTKIQQKGLFSDLSFLHPRVFRVWKVGMLFSDTVKPSILVVLKHAFTSSVLQVSRT